MSSDSEEEHGAEWSIYEERTTKQKEKQRLEGKGRKGGRGGISIYHRNSYRYPVLIAHSDPMAYTTMPSPCLSSCEFYGFSKIVQVGWGW